MSGGTVGANSGNVVAAPALCASTGMPTLLERTRLRVLLIEDSEADYRATERLLVAAQHVEFSVERAQDLKDGLARLGEGAFDVCLLDQGLPDGDGLELMRAALRRPCRAPIIMLTGQSALKLDMQAMELGVADFIEKDRVDAVLLERTIRYAVARQHHADHLSRLAQYDELTGLANRTLFRDRLDRALAWARRHERLAAVIILDLNGFKVVNDRLGHSAGDRLLGLMANRLTGRLRETDTVARLGGDEFAVVIENLAKPEHAALVARKLLDTVAPPLEIDGRTVTVTASLGVALYPKDSQDAASLIREADRAMYRAKSEGGNLCRFASDQMERRVQRGALMVTDLRRGLAAGEFVLHYQPQVTLTPGAVGISTMIRWNHPEAGLIGSERFLPLAEDHGMLEPLSGWLFEAACAQARSWRDQGVGRLHVALPLLSRQQLAWSGLQEHLASALGRFALDPGCLEIELSEEMLLADATSGGAGVAALRRLGVRLALDGFGRGPTSLRSLQLGVLDTVKLSRELHREVPGDRGRAAVLAALASLARELGLRIVAEGIDSHEQLAFLRRCGCDAVQAFMSCPPLPAEACTGWLRLAGARRDGGVAELPSRNTGARSSDRPAHPPSLGAASPDRRLAAGAGRSPG